MPLFHHVDVRVMWADTDPAGIVWYGVRGTERLILEASYRVACVDARTFAPRSFPPVVGSLLRPAIRA